MDRDPDAAELSDGTDPIPALLRASRGAYSHAIHRSLAEAGLGDLPRNGPFIVGGLVNHGVAAGDLVRQLGVSKQAAGQLLDVLVLRGFIVREEDPDDRRRVRIVATDRGRQAAAVVRAAITSVDAELRRRISAEQWEGLHAGLVALCDIREAFEEAHASAG